MSIRKVIERELQKRGKSIYWLAKQSDVPYSRLHSYLNGDSESLRSDSVERVFIALDISIAPKPF